MTQAELKKAVQALGMTCRFTDGEIRVAFQNDEGSAYYTNDREDALHTARDIAARRKAQGAGRA